MKKFQAQHFLSLLAPCWSLVYVMFLVLVCSEASPSWLPAEALYMWCSLCLCVQKPLPPGSLLKPCIYDVPCACVFRSLCLLAPCWSLVYVMFLVLVCSEASPSWLPAEALYIWCSLCLCVQKPLPPGSLLKPCICDVPCACVFRSLWYKSSLFFFPTITLVIRIGLLPSIC